jgi:hypothetical protein
MNGIQLLKEFRTTLINSHVLRNSVKREASDDISQRPSKRIRKALQEQEEEQLEPKELQKP